MKLLEIYESYKKTHEVLEQELENVIQAESVNEEAFANCLKEIQSEIEDMMVKIPESVQSNTVEEDHLKDLQYLVADTSLFLMDLIHFLSIGEIGRSRMRCINYLSKRRRVQI